jgi:hypothetical protein
MATGFDRARLKLPLRFFRYFLSRPSFDIDRNPAVLTVMLQRPWRRARAVVVVAFVVVFGAVVIHAVRSGSSVLVDDLSDSLLPLLAMAAFWAALTFGQKRLMATFGNREVTVQEGGIRAPRWRWTVPIASFSASPGASIAPRSAMRSMSSTRRPSIGFGPYRKRPSSIGSSLPIPIPTRR